MVFQIQKGAVAQIVAAPLSAIVASTVLFPGQGLAVPSGAELHSGKYVQPHGNDTNYN